MYDDGFWLCNPTTRQVFKIPDDVSRWIPRGNCYLYLGYDKSKDEYKILRRWKTRFGPVEHSVCTLERGQKQTLFSSWRHVESNIPFHKRYTNVLCINEVVYYGVKIQPSERFVIASFNVAYERLLFIEPPKGDDENKVLDPLINYHGKLAYFFVNADNNSYVLWLLDNVEKQIWSSKTGLLPPSFCDSYRELLLTICGATDAGEIVFSPTNAFDELFFYDLNKNNLTRRVLGSSIGSYRIENMILKR